IPLEMIFSKKQMVVLSVSMVILILIVAISCNCNCMGYLMLLNAFSGLLFVCNIILAEIANQTMTFSWEQSTYQLTLKHVRQEEELKADFSNYLHDEVLQDLLSIKNMMGKSNRPEIHQLILETLTQLNTTIRKQMQDYHPVMLKNLTIKENYQNLIETTHSACPQKNVIVSFDCAENIFLIAPYHLIIYRFIKELLTNAYKHSDGSHVWITLVQKKEEIELSVCDNGSTNAANIDRANNVVHKGVFSIQEQVKSLNGAMLISDNHPHGICIRISILIKGDNSYEYFIGR
ncbi:MAG: ATP-binding protein, partial [Lachnospiraceae bacterium]|nr:ATP-binding protein [Lachnospiraceae bacterium]